MSAGKIMVSMLVLVAVLTAFGGAGFVVTGAALILGLVETGTLADGVLGAIRGQPLAVVAWLGLSVVALAQQLVDASDGGLGLATRLDRSLA